MKIKYPAIGRSAFIGLTAALSAMLVSVASATTYYVDSTGGLDTNNGISTSTPWQTLSKVSSITYAAGDKILFKKDRQFLGTLTLVGNGASGNPITVDSYATGSETNKPVIVGTSGTDGAILMTARAWWIIQNIQVQSAVTDGLAMKNSSNISVLNVDFTNIAYLGQGYINVTGGSCITMMDNGGYTPCTNITVDGCTFQKAASGVVIGSATNAIVQNCYFSELANFGHLWEGNVFHARGADGVPWSCKDCKVRTSVFSNTNCNADQWNPIMLGGTDNCSVELNEIRFSRTYSAGIQVDHQVFDFDTQCHNSYIQYNYTHDNYGSLMLSYFNQSDNGGCVVRYNLFVGESTFAVHPTIVHNAYGLLVYNNTFYNFKGNFGRNPIAGDLNNGGPVQNNIFHLQSTLSGTWSNPNWSSNNMYYNATAPAGETGSINGAATFVNAAVHPHGLRLQSGSLGINAGASIANNGGRDYWGTTLYSGAADIGAHEYNGSATPTYANLAHRQTVTTSSSVENWGWFRTCLVDGETNSIGSFTNSPGAMGWSSALGITANHTEWVEVNLGATSVTFNKVVLYPRNDGVNTGAGFPVDFKIQVWNGAAWLDRVTQTAYPKPGKAGQVFSWSPADVTNRVRIYATSLTKGAGTDYIMQLAEVQVLNNASPAPPAYVPIGNKALGMDVAASTSAENWGWYRTKLTDGKRGSIGTSGSSGSMGWSSWPGSNQEWVMVDLGAISSVSRVTLYGRDDAGNVGVNFPPHIQIYTSPDDINYTIVISDWTNPVPPVTYSFGAQNARYVKIYFPSLGTALVQLAEMEVY